MTEKRKPTYDLEAFKAAFSSVDGLALTGTALRTSAALGFGRAEIVTTIQSMRRGQFYKSMTTQMPGCGKTSIMCSPRLESST